MSGGRGVERLRALDSGNSHIQSLKHNLDQAFLLLKDCLLHPITNSCLSPARPSASQTLSRKTSTLIHCASVVLPFFPTRETHHTYSHPRAFARAVTSAWHALPWNLTWLRSLRCWLQLHFLSEVFLYDSVPRGPSFTASLSLLGTALRVEVSCMFLCFFFHWNVTHRNGALVYLVYAGASVPRTVLGPC